MKYIAYGNDLWNKRNSTIETCNDFIFWNGMSSISNS